MSGSANTVSWGNWLEALPAALTDGECIALLIDERFEYLDPTLGWQFSTELCPGETFQITASANDRFCLPPNGPWVTASGDASMEVPRGAPCQEEGCLAGMVVGLFEGEDGSKSVFPVGTSLRFTAPTGGMLSISLNDDDYSDNSYAIEDGVRDSTAITIRPGS